MKVWFLLAIYFLIGMANMVSANRDFAAELAGATHIKYLLKLVKYRTINLDNVLILPYTLFFVNMELIPLLFYFLIIIPSSIIHEYAHGFVADKLGDPTARYAGRLTVNPIPHIDLWGTILMPIILLLASGGTFMFAYAKPVPYNPYNLKNQKWGPVWVGLAGPAANLLLAISFALLYRFIPFSPALAQLFGIIVMANVILMVFNLVPIPPLDGSKVLLALLPTSAFRLRMTLEKFGMVLVLVFVIFFFELLRPVINILVSLLLG